MGAWSKHPMGCDQALDDQYDFLSRFNIDEDTSYLDREPTEIAKELEKLSLEDLIDSTQSCYSYVIPFTYLQYGIKPKDPEIRKVLKECLHDWPDCGFFKEGKKLIEFFYNHFDDVMDGKVEVPEDPGLLATIIKHKAEGKTGLVNIIESDRDS